MNKASTLAATVLVSLAASGQPILRFETAPTDFPANAINVQRTGPLPAVSTNLNPLSQEIFSRIRFDPEAGYLVFASQGSFNQALNALEDEIDDFKLDHGQTSHLLGLIRAANDNSETKNLLIKHSPLSDEVLIAFLNKRFPAEMVQQVLDANIQLSEKVAAAYQTAPLPRNIRSQIDQKRLKNIAYNNPVLRDFEDRFSGYESLRKKGLERETAFLATGADPESPANPANEPTAVDDVLATVLNKHKEVKIGVDVYVALREKDIRVAGADKAILNYIRTNGDVPRNRVPVGEPANGLLKASSPPPIDPRIEVEPNAKYNMNCGGVEIGGTNDGTGRMSFNVKDVRDPGFQYYWDFGDGLVSYKRNPSHKYSDGQSNHKVGVTVFSPMGTACSPNGSGTSVSAPGNSCGAVLQVADKNELTVTFAATSIFGTPPLNHNWDFGDTTTANTGINNTATHTYSHGATFGVTVTIVDSNLCSATSGGGVTVSKNAPPSCDNRGKEKDKWLSPNKTHKFNHKFKLKNFLNTPSRIKARIGTHYKGLLNIWWPDSTASTISIFGDVYTSVSKPCDTEQSISVGPESDTKFVLRAKYLFNVPGISVKPNKVFTTATAYGGSNTLTFLQ
jgi:hypothetical protein